MPILVVGLELDPHVEKVVAQLRKCGCEAFVFNRYSSDSRLAFSVEQSRVGGWLRSGSARVNIGEIDAVWWRLKSMLIEEFTGAFNNNAEVFCDREWRAALHSFPVFCGDAFGVNPLEAQTRVNYKPFQLALAKAHGLQIPDTVFTNSHDDVLNLFASHERVVYKQLSWTMFPPDEVIFTNEVNKDLIRRSERGIGLAPSIFQQYTDKSAELRVMVVGEEMFSVSIDSQRFAKTKIDWRHSQFEEMFTINELNTCMALRRSPLSGET